MWITPHGSSVRMRASIHLHAIHDESWAFCPSLSLRSDLLRVSLLHLALLPTSTCTLNSFHVDIAKANVPCASANRGVLPSGWIHSFHIFQTWISTGEYDECGPSSIHCILRSPCWRAHFGTTVFLFSSWDCLACLFEHPCHVSSKKKEEPDVHRPLSRKGLRRDEAQDWSLQTQVEKANGKNKTQCIGVMWVLFRVKDCSSFKRDQTRSYTTEVVAVKWTSGSEDCLVRLSKSTITSAWKQSKSWFISSRRIWLNKRC